MRKGTCKYHIGSWHNTHCATGVEYQSVLSEPTIREGSAYRYPCVQDWSWCKSPLTESQQAHFERRGTCAKYTEPTPEDIAAYEAEVKAVTGRFLLAVPVLNRIKREHKGKDWKGVEMCPACNGRLHMTHAAYNGHVWGQCETKNCLSWME